MNKKKVLFMLTSMNIGGVEKSLLSLLSVIPKDKYDITILLLEKKGGFLNDIPDWVKVEEAVWFKKIKPVIMQPPKKTIADHMNKKEFLSVPAFAVAYFLSKKMDNRYLYYSYVLKNVPDNSYEYDAAIAYQGPTDVIDFYIANKVKAASKISWVHFDVSKHQINLLLYEKLYSKMTKIYTVSVEARNKLVEKMPSVGHKTEVVISIVSPKVIVEMSLKEVNFDGDYKGIKLVTVGRLSREKGQDIAIKVLSKLRTEGYEIKWYCVGEGNNRQEYEKLIEKYNLKDYFILLGAKKNPYPYIKQADIYIQPSRNEGYCLTLAEARRLNKPIVTTNFTGASEQIQVGVTGLIAGSTEDLYNNIKKLIDYPEKRKLLTDNLRKQQEQEKQRCLESNLFEYII
ncbi:glycosyltransferase [Evansella clarkii]|uniref:glycosyltransferase n=1 Tax=Evansella clarkii TaxID=79879 RepID=UPI001F285B02|nr:glycosyltransferase [Evansella clarkii]